jgi:uncharacterized repeat protein (TIGR03803 family)
MQIINRHCSLLSPQFLLVALALTGLAAVHHASASTLKTLYVFCSDIYCNYGGDGPSTDLTMDASGNIYGTTMFGGTGMCGLDLSGAGVAFQLSPNAAKTKWTGKVIYDFSCSHGANPNSNLVIAPSGTLYGTTEEGGAYYGTVFALKQNAAKTKFTETVVYNFGSQSNDGGFPTGHLIMDGSGNLYGTTYSGGGFGQGTVFKLSPNSAKTDWKETILHSFCAKLHCTDGQLPAGGVIKDSAGNLFGTTSAGGVYGGGTIFELIPASTGWSYKILYNFCSMRGCVDGTLESFLSYSGLTMDTSGNLYGTTIGGGAYSYDGGTVFKLEPNAAKTKWSHQVLHSFCSQPACADGQNPFADVFRDAAGNLYGTTEYAGAHGRGTVFALTPNAAKTKWAETVLYSFCSKTNCADGESPWAGLIRDGAGNFYGTTFAGGGASYDKGTVFELEH